MSDEEKALLEKSEKFAEETGIAMNPDEKIVNAIITGLLWKKQSNGELYCPCRALSGDKEKDKDIICPCIFHQKEIEDMSHCHCNLFVAKK